MMGKVTKLWMTRPRTTVTAYIPSWRPISPMFVTCKTCPPTKKRIPTGVYLWEEEDWKPRCVKSRSQDTFFKDWNIKKNKHFFSCLLIDMQDNSLMPLVLTRLLCRSDAWRLYLSTWKSPSEVSLHSPFCPGPGQRRWKGWSNPKY